MVEVVRSGASRCKYYHNYHDYSTVKRSQTATLVLESRVLMCDVGAQCNKYVIYPVLEQHQQQAIAYISCNQVI